jgi:SAM-dependent methyltransferase
VTPRPDATPGTEPTDVARNLARLYDLDLLEDPGDVGLYFELAERTGGPILELAAGSGRIAVPLASAGYDVTGVDLDTAMLERALARTRAAGRRITGSLELVEADLIGLELPRAGSFNLAFIALNSLFLLATRARQQAALETLARHLARGGLGVVDVWLPEPDDLARFDGRLMLEYTRPEPETEADVTKLASARFDPSTAVVDLTAIYEEAMPGQPALRWVRRDQLRLVTSDELRSMAEDAGLAVETIAGGYDLEPIETDSDRAILVARRS